MALITTPGPECESLCSVADADDYHGKRGNATRWETLDGTRKEQKLRQAYDWLFARFGSRWPEGEAFGAVLDVTMRGASNACAQLALYAMDGPLAPELAPQVTKQKVGPIETEYAAAINNGERTFPDVARMMAPYLVPLNRYSIPLRRA